VFLQEDPILLTPEDKDQKPYVAIIKVNSLVKYIILPSVDNIFQRYVVGLGK